jgi:hypothetical protein
MDDLKIVLKHHRNKVKLTALSLFGIFFVILGIFLVYSFSKSKYTKQCTNIFDEKDLDGKKRMCCNPEHYNSSDKMCQIKCDTLEVNPDSYFCKEILTSLDETPLAKELDRAQELLKDAPKCLNFTIKNTTESLNYALLKPSNPLQFEFNVEANTVKPKYFIYEYYTIENNDIRTAKPISFEENKNLISVSPAQTQTGKLYRDSFQALYENFYKPNLNNERKIPYDILVTTSIIDEKDQRRLQPQGCYFVFRLSEESTYCREFKLSTSKLTDNEKLKVNLTSNLPSTYGFEFRFQNLENYSTVNSLKEYKPISFTKVNNENIPFVFSQEAKGNNSISIEFDWDDFYQKDLNFKNRFPQFIKVLGYIKPLPTTKIENIVPCTLDLELDIRQGIDLCKDISLSGVDESSTGQKILKPNGSITIESQATTKNIQKFTFTFHNLDNVSSNKRINNITNASPIYFEKEDPFEISKSSNKSDSKSILVSFNDLNKVDLATGQKPKNIQVRAYFENTDERISNLNKSCVTNFKIE